MILGGDIQQKQAYNIDRKLKQQTTTRRNKMLVNGEFPKTVISATEKIEIQIRKEAKEKGKDEQWIENEKMYRGIA
jgi:hypothetical protein